MTTADAMFLHENGQDVAFLIEIGELLAETEETFVWRRCGAQPHPVDAGALLPISSDLEGALGRRLRKSACS